MFNHLKKLSIVLICTVIFMFLVAAGVEETGIHVAETISSTMQFITGGSAIITGLFSAWLLIVCAMCRTLSNIPGVQTKKADSGV